MSPCPFPTTITITPRAPPNIYHNNNKSAKQNSKTNPNANETVIINIIISTPVLQATFSYGLPHLYTQVLAT